MVIGPSVLGWMAPNDFLTPLAAPPSAQASRYPDAATKARIVQLLARIEDAYFEYTCMLFGPMPLIKALEGDSIELRDILKFYPDYKLTIERHRRRL